MPKECKAEKENVYLRCRKRASHYNELLKSRESTADLLGISSSTLTKYELGITKTVPVDMVVLMAELYHAPELKNLYCKQECPIGKQMPVATDSKGISNLTVRMLNSLDDDEIKGMKKDLLRIAEDGKITADEEQDFNKILTRLDEIAVEISELKMLAEKYEDR